MVTGPSKPSYSIGAFTFANSPSAHQLTSEGELAAHNHGYKTMAGVSQDLDSGPQWRNPAYLGSDANAGNSQMGTLWAGSNLPHNNLLPLYGVYKFRRTN